MPKVVANLQGGLGNQLFIWAAGVALARKLEATLEVAVAGIEKKSRLLDPRSYELDYFGVEARFTSPTEAQNKGLLPALLARRGSTESFSEATFGFDPRFRNLKAPVSLDGYFQSKKYFSDCDELIQTTLLDGARPSQELLEIRKYLGKNWAAVHIRRGDYLHHTNVFSIPSREYYSQAISILKRATDIERIVVFSDDVESSKKMRLEVTDYIAPVDLPRVGDHMLLMSEASGFVGSNSSFSWWSTFLSKQISRTNIFPRPWFANGEPSALDLLEPSWLTLGSQ